jgi:hypothetical protein
MLRKPNGYAPGLRSGHKEAMIESESYGER